MLLSFEIHYGSGHHFLEKDKPYNPGMLYFRESPFFPGADVSQSIFFANTNNNNDNDRLMAFDPGQPG